MRRVLVIGGGGIARRHIMGFTKTGRATVALVEPVASRRAALIAEFGLTEGYATVAQAPLRAFDFAVICAPADVHLDLMHRCMDAGLPFLVEKPLAAGANGVAATVARVRESGLVARVGFARRCGPEIMDLRARVHAGEIGDLRMAHVYVAQEYLRYRPDLRQTFFVDEAKGGGAVVDIGSHIFDLLVWIMGPVAQVGAMTATLGIDGIGVEDSCLVHLRFASGAMASVTINLFQKPDTGRWDFIGTKGTLALDHSRMSLHLDDSPAPAETRDFAAGLTPQSAHQARFERQAALLLDHLDGAPCHLATVAEAAHVLAIALAAKEAWRTGRIVTL